MPGRPASHVEHERTYTVPDGAVVPFGADAAGDVRVAQVRQVVLRARYLDTERLDLLRRGVTLRRRAGGTDEGWHLKVPVGPDRRRELQVPLGDGAEDEVPAAILDEVAGLVRDRPLQLVATVATDREETHLVDAEGRGLAVLCDDRVRAGSALPDGGATVWREWELELAPGRKASDLRTLERLIEPVGARRSDQPSKLGRTLGPRPPAPSGPGRRTAGGVLHARLAEQVEELLRRDADVRAGRDGGVHGQRVAARRLRSALQTARPLLRAGSTDHLRAELRTLGQVLGPARDAEVLEARLRAAVAREQDELVLGPVVARLTTELHRDRDRAAARVRSALGSDRYRRLLDDLDAFVDDLPLRPVARRKAAGVLADLVRRDAVRVHRAARVARRASGPARDEALHELRKSAKRLRYAAELAAPVGGRRTRRVVARAKAVQQALGDHQDSAVARRTLRRLGVAAHLAGENGFTFGVLLGAERLRAREARESAADAVARLPRPGTAARWVRG